MDYNDKVIRRGDILICELGEGIGSEQGGKRPCVVVQNDLGNRYSPTVIVAALTSSNGKSKLPTHIHVDVADGVSRPSVILCEQIRTINKSRICGFVGRINMNAMERVNEALNISLDTITSKEIEVIKMAEMLRGREESILELNGLIAPHLLNQMVQRFKIMLYGFEDACIKNRVCKEDYYAISNELMELMGNINMVQDNKTMLRVV